MVVVECLGDSAQERRILAGSLEHRDDRFRQRLSPEVTARLDDGNAWKLIIESEFPDRERGGNARRR